MNASAGYSGTPLPKKLGIKEGGIVATFAAPDHFEGLLQPLPAGVQLRRNPAVRDRSTCSLPSYAPRPS